ncbi:MAG TPA: STAS/SEC14 domain-containing protein [Myxococcales bacterium]|jgi:hypothetical protein
MASIPPPSTVKETSTAVTDVRSHLLAGGPYLHSVQKPNAIETGKTARENHGLMKQLVPPGTKLPMLVDSRKVGSIDKEAKEVYASETGAFATCVAIVGDNPVVTMMANVFLMLSNPKCPTKLFSNEEAALKWLGEHRR